MNYPIEKRDSLTEETTYPTDIKQDLPTSQPPKYNPIDVTRPQTYDIKNTKTDWIYSGAYSLRTSRDDPSTEAWNVRISSKALEIYRPDGSLVGTVGLHSFSSKVDVSMHDSGSVRDFQMQKKGFVCMLSTRSFTVKGKTFTWKSASKLGMKFKLLDEAGDQVAWIGPTSWKGRYRFELNKGGLDAEIVEAILLTALAINEIEKRNNFAASSSASSSAAASVAVS